MCRDCHLLCGVKQTKPIDTKKAVRKFCCGHERDFGQMSNWLEEVRRKPRHPWLGRRVAEGKASACGAEES